MAVQLTERDEAVLQALARFRLARTSDLVAYAFAGVRQDTAAVRLRRLFDARYLAVLPPRLGAENVYRLGPAGRQHLVGHGVRIGQVPRGGLEHHLSVVQAWVSMAGLADFELERCLSDWEIREQFMPAELRVIPDLFALVRVEGELHAAAVEVDCGTESPSVLGRKLEAYRSLWGQPPGLFGYDRFGIAVACYDPSCRVAVASAIKKAWVVPHVFWVVPESPSSALHKLFAELRTPLNSTP